MADKKKPQNTCFLCGRSEQDTVLMITGLRGCICADCVIEANKILKTAGFADEEEGNDKDKKKNSRPRRYQSRTR